MSTADMFGSGADPAWSMNTCHLSFEFVSKRSFCGLITASAAFKARVAVRFADVGGAAEAALARSTTCLARAQSTKYWIVVPTARVRDWCPSIQHGGQACVKTEQELDYTRHT